MSSVNEPEQGGQRISAEPELGESGGRDRDREYQRLASIQPARGQRTSLRAPHLAIGLALIPLIESGGSGSDQSGSDDGVEQRQRDASRQPFWAPKKYPTPVLIRMSQVIRGLVNAM